MFNVLDTVFLAIKCWWIYLFTIAHTNKGGEKTVRGFYCLIT